MTPSASAYTAFIDETLKRFEDDAQRLRQALARRTPENTMTNEAVQAEIDKLLGEGAAADDARVAKLQRVLELRAGIEVKRKQIEELKANRGLAAATVLDPARQSEWTFGEKQFFRAGFKDKVLQSAGGFSGLLAALTPDEREAVDKLIDARINPFVQLNSSTRRALEEIRARPQLSFSFLSKRRQRGDDEYTADLIYERGLGTRTFATLNAGFKYKNSPLLGGDARGGKVAGQLQFQVTPEESLISKSPIFLYLSGDAEWLSGVRPKYRAQAKVKIPLADGIEIPFSVTYANRTDLIDESDVRGQVGFTFDTARLLRAFKFRLPSVNNRTIDLSSIAPRVTPISGQ